MIERVMLIPKILFFFRGNLFSWPFSQPAREKKHLLFILFSSEEWKDRKGKNEESWGKKKQTTEQPRLKYTVYMIIYVKKIGHSWKLNKDVYLPFICTINIYRSSGGKDIWKCKLYQNTITQILCRVIKGVGYSYI